MSDKNLLECLDKMQATLNEVRELCTQHGMLTGNVLPKGVEETVEQWIAEFGSAYDVPPDVRDLVEAGALRDVSWHNDTAPSFVRGDDMEDADADESNCRKLWVEHIDPMMREDTRFRFAVTVDCDTLYQGDDLNAAIVAMGFVAFPEFVASGRGSDNLGDDIGDSALEGVAGRTYLGMLHIEDSMSWGADRNADGRWYVMLDCGDLVSTSEYMSDELLVVERLLYDHAMAAGYADRKSLNPKGE